MIHAHTAIYKKLTPVQTLALWNHLYDQHLVEEPPDPRISRGDVLAEKVQHLSHAEVVMAIAGLSSPFWCDVLCSLLEKPIYMCARGETGIPMYDMENRPLPLPIGHRRGEAAGTGGLPRKVKMRLGTKAQYHKKIDPRVIKTLIDYNPKMPGTKSHERFGLYTVGMSVSEYVALGGKAADIAHDVGKGFITVDMP